MKPDNRCYTPLGDGAECCLPFWHDGDHKSPGMGCHDIEDPDRWGMTWALCIALASPTDRDAGMELVFRQVEAAEALGGSCQAFDLEAGPLMLDDCRYYRRRKGHDLADIGYGRHLPAFIRAMSDALRD